MGIQHRTGDSIMDEAKLYWTIVVGVLSAGWVVIAFIRDRISESVNRTSAMMNRLMEGDMLTIEHPEIQKYISQNAHRGVDYFRNETVLGEELFYKAKTAVYRQLNLFDEMLSTSSRTSRGYSFLKPPALIEISDWETYIRVKLRHPLYRSILIHERKLFGASLRDFWDKYKREIESSPVDPFIW